MPRHLLGFGCLISCLISSPALAVSFEELEAENIKLRAQLATLASNGAHPTSGSALADSSGDHSGHGHNGHSDGGHSHGGGCCHDHCKFDYIQPFEEHHETIDGYPMMHMFKTEHAWLERKVQFFYAAANDADDGTVDESEFEVEFFWALNNRFAFLIEVPVICLDPVTGDNTSGIGDLEVGVQFVAFQGELTILSFGFNVTTPTGDSDRDLGTGHTVLIPKSYLWHDLGDGWGLQADVSFEIPVSVEEPENTFLYNVGINRILPGSCCWGVFRHLTPSFEVNCQTLLNGVESGQTIVNFTPGIRWMMREHDQCGVAWSFPVTNVRESEGEFLFSYIVHF